MKPKKDEKRQQFMSRCLTDAKMKEEYKNMRQRFAVCADSWRDNK